MKLTSLLLGLTLVALYPSSISAQAVSNKSDNTVTNEPATPRTPTVFINDNGAVYPLYVPNLSENTKIQEVWNEAAVVLGTRYFDLYFNGQKMSLSKSFADYWIVGNFTMTLEVRKR